MDRRHSDSQRALLPLPHGHHVKKKNRSVVPYLSIPGTLSVPINQDVSYEHGEKLNSSVR